MREAASGMPAKMMREDAMPACPAHQPLLSGPPSAALAQLVEHIIRNDGVTCSSHVSGTIFLHIFKALIVHSTLSALHTRRARAAIISIL